MHPGTDDEFVGRVGIQFGDGMKDAARADEIFGVEPSADVHHGAMDVFEAGGDVAGFPEIVVVHVFDLIVPIAVFLFQEFMGVRKRAHLKVELVAVGGAVVVARLGGRRGDCGAGLENV